MLGLAKKGPELKLCKELRDTLQKLASLELFLRGGGFFLLLCFLFKNSFRLDMNKSENRLFLLGRGHGKNNPGRVSEENLPRVELCCKI